MSPDPTRIQALTDMSPLKMKKELQSFLGILNYLHKFSLVTADMCEPLDKLTSVKTDWTWNRIYQDLYEKAKTIVKRDSCMKFIDVAKPLYLETDASSIGL